MFDFMTKTMELKNTIKVYRKTFQLYRKIIHAVYVLGSTFSKWLNTSAITNKCFCQKNDGAFSESFGLSDVEKTIFTMLNAQ